MEAWGLCIYWLVMWNSSDYIGILQIKRYAWLKGRLGLASNVGMYLYHFLCGSYSTANDTHYRNLEAVFVSIC